MTLLVYFSFKGIKAQHRTLTIVCLAS
jgi:hypothetical protein